MAVLLQAGAIEGGRLWLLIGTIGMVLGTAYFIGTGWREEHTAAKRLYAVIISVSAIAAVAYLLMTLEYGLTTVTHDGDTDTVYWIRYLYWLITTPLILIALGVIAEGTRRTIGALVGFDVSMVLLGLATVLAGRGMSGLDSETLKLVLWGASVVAYLSILLLLTRPLSRTAAKQSAEAAMLFSMLRNIVIILLALYPTVWLLGYVLDFIPVTAAVGVYLVGDLLMNVGFGVLLLRSDTIRNQTAGTRTPTLVE